MNITGLGALIKRYNILDYNEIAIFLTNLISHIFLLVLYLTFLFNVYE